MRITGLRATPVAIPFTEDEVWAFGRRRGMVSVLLEVTTDEGVVGLGEAAAYPSADIIHAVIDSIEPLVIGEDPHNIERIMKRVNIIGTWHHVKASSPAIAAVEMACWDIVGKASNQPLVNLFGGKVRDAVEYFYYLSHKPAAEMAGDAADGYAQGFRTFYIKVGSGEASADIERVEAIRAATGPDAKIRVDPNEAWSSAHTLKVIGEMEQFGLELVEQPISGRNLEEMAYLRGKMNSPLLANEASWNRYDQLELIKAGAADAVSVDNQMDGGLLNLKRGAGLCEVAGLPVLKHSLGELGVAQYAALHVMASTPNFIYANQGYGSFLSDDIIEGASPLPYVNGRLEVPTGPGIGVKLDRDRVEKYAELYAQEAKNFSFHEPDKITDTPLMPKR